MTGKHGKPDRRSPKRSGKIPQKPVNSSIPPLKFPLPQDMPAAQSPSLTDPRPAKHSPSSGGVAVQPVRLPSPPTGQDKSLSLPQWVPRNWQFWGALSVITFSGLGIFSALTLFSLPDSPNCPAIFLPTASASMRLYCAQMLAGKHTVESLLKAIDLVNDMPSDHPLRSEIDRNVEDWSQEILKLAEGSFQNGELEKAISTVRRIPAQTAAYGLVTQQIEDWKTLWAKAETIYQEAEEDLRQNDLKQAFLTATRLLSVGNKYWETTKYKQLSALITDTRVDGGKLDKAKGLAEQGGVENLLAAMKLVEEIKPTSHLYSEATSVTSQLGQKMLDLADAALDRRDYKGATNIVQQIPERANLKAEIQDFNTLAQARAQGWGGTSDDLQAAIQQARKLKNDRPLYSKAQQLVTNWQLEIQDIAYLERARQLAQPGSIGDLSAAIAEAQQVPASNPRGKEAQDAIDGWTATIQTIEDRPYLNRAEQFASIGDLPSLQRAINEASRIGAGRALYDQADQLIRDWTNRIQQAQDQPLLDRARQFANQGNLRAAIDTASQIGDGRALSREAEANIQDWTQRSEQVEDRPYLERARQLAAQGDLSAAIATAGQIREGRSLYDDAQADIRTWSSQSEGLDRMQQAYSAARVSTPPMLLSAIQIADQIPANSPQRSEADRMIEQWSFQILQNAESQAPFSLTSAIAIAESIPPGTGAYGAAQKDIQTWRQQLRR
ncbi:MAG: chromosome segregation ATPase [Drouetiella hepatica Uher 2000/2452]|uniref:Chromosome segregation ATPase n=1 Tax=Drouetiella hepatica Uher 2000/2452 TaxID=904376 RepID=A0A951QA53_9CYAN|nr:chromosome segregation ATPase [Drouetiella hepatica Uher 2000/2452]